MRERMLGWTRARGYRLEWGSLEAAVLASRDVQVRHASGEFDQDFYDKNLRTLGLPEPIQSYGERVLAVVMPRPAHSVVFTLRDGPRAAIIPPTYVRYSALFDEVASDLRAYALPPGSRVERVNAPLKSLAARLGLVRYGRNNLTYDPDFGTSIQLFAYLTDAPLPVPDGWRPSEPELLPECESCCACLDACPTRAIGSDRVLLHGERCLTFWNENDGLWPTWLSSDAHHCLVGCLACQDACPMNARIAVTDTGVVFSAEETAAILKDDPKRDSPVWQSIRGKLARIGRTSEECLIGRNLRALLASGYRRANDG